jgi:hypothetical protein
LFTKAELSWIDCSPTTLCAFSSTHVMQGPSLAYLFHLVHLCSLPPKSIIMKLSP